MPSTSARPPSGRRMVVRMRIAVVLPAPLGPSNPNTVPAGTEKSIPPSAVREPNRLVRCSTRTAWSLREDPPTLLIASAAPILRGPAGVAPSHGSGDGLIEVAINAVFALVVARIQLNVTHRCPSSGEVR